MSHASQQGVGARLSLTNRTTMAAAIAAGAILAIATSSSRADHEYFVTVVGNETCTLITFEGGGDVEAIHSENANQIPGTIAHFPSWVTLTEGAGLYADAPSPVTVALWVEGGSFQDVTFDSPVASVGLFYCSAADVVLEAFDANDVLVASATGLATFGESSFPPFNVWAALVVDAGTNVITRIRVNGEIELTAIDDFQYCVIGAANTPPTADAGPDQDVECTSSAGASVTLAGSGDDDDGDTVSFLWSVPSVTLDDATSATPTGVFPIGSTLATLTVSDGQGGEDTDDVLITVHDSAPPDVDCMTNIGVLWPPNHQRVPVCVFIMATDDCTEPGDLILNSVTVSSDEPDNAIGSGDGHTTGDTHFADGYASPVDVTDEFEYCPSLGFFVGTVWLRAERQGGGDGRTYTISADVEDVLGNISTATCVVLVPHSQRRCHRWW